MDKSSQLLVRKQSQHSLLLELFQELLLPWELCDLHDTRFLTEHGIEFDNIIIWI